MVLSATVIAGCGDDRATERLSSRDAPPAAAILAPGEVHDLVEELRLLDAELAAALEEGSVERLLRAEAMTDQLMLAPREVDWLSTGYDLQARIRQLQAMADRIVARLRRGATLGAVAEDIQITRAAVQELLVQVQRPGGGAPPPRLDSLLAQDPLRDVQARSARAASAAAGQATGAVTGAATGQQQPAQDPAQPAPAQPPPPRPPQQQGPLGTPVPAPPDSLLN